MLLLWRYMSDAVKPANTPHIGFALSNPFFTFWSLLGQGVRERAAELGVTLSVLPFSPDPDQIAIERFIAQPLGALIIPGETVIPGRDLVALAGTAGVPVVGVERVLDNTTCAVYSDDHHGGALAAMYLAEQLAGQGTVLHIQTTRGPRTTGFLDTITQHPGITVVCIGEGDDWSRERGQVLMRNALADHLQIRGVFAANDILALGAIDTLKEIGYADRVIVVGYDALPEGLLTIAAGVLAASVHRSPHRVGRIALEVAHQLAHGVTVPPEICTESTLITTNNVMDAALDALSILPRLLHDLVASQVAQQQMQRTTITMQQQIIERLAQRLSRQERQRLDLVLQAMTFMQEHVETTISIAEVAKMLHVSRSSFHELFTSTIGRSPKDFLIDLRIERAKQYLAHTNMSVLEIADTLGYDPSYFSRLFKQRTGFAPGDYARRKRMML